MTRDSIERKVRKLEAVADLLEKQRRFTEAYRYRDFVHALAKRHNIPYWQTARDIKRRKVAL